MKALWRQEQVDVSFGERERRVMSKFAIKGLVVPLISFDLSLFPNPNPNPNPTPPTKHCWQTSTCEREKEKDSRGFSFSLSKAYIKIAISERVSLYLCSCVHVTLYVLLKQRYNTRCYSFNMLPIKFSLLFVQMKYIPHM